jgi:large subunit ribosomal protein L13
VEKTYYPKAADITEEWVLVDAKNQLLGRLASRIATVLLGKDKPTFTPGVNPGVHVVVVNCEGVRTTGKKMDEKFYYRYSGYPSGLKSTSLRQQLEKHPDRVLTSAVWGMLPHNKFGRQLLKNLKIYAGPEHPHQAQNPQPLTISIEE